MLRQSAVVATPAGDAVRSAFLSIKFGLLCLFSILMLATVNVEAAAPKINTLNKSGLFGKYKQTGIAVRGYDTVAYFTQGKPVKGVTDFEVEWEGAKWYFSSQEHKDLFVGDPEKYAPQYGGYCAYGVAEDYLVKIEPDQWAIVDDKLYLNFDRKINNRWHQDIPGYLKKAEGKLEGLLQRN